MSIDVTIVGGGLVGLTAALALSRQGHEVTLLESSDLQQAHPAELDARSIALSYSSVQIFRALTVWPLLQTHAAAIRQIHVSSAGHFGVTRLHAVDEGVEAMGYVIEYHLLMAGLLQAVRSDSRITLLTPARLASLQPFDDRVEIQYQQGNEDCSRACSLLVIADGGHSGVRDKLAIPVETHDYRQSAIVANLRIEQAMQGEAYERFTPQGPLAMLPLPKQRYAMVWTHSPDRAEALMDLSDEDFVQQLYQVFGYRLGMFSAIGQRARFDLRLSRARQLVTQRCVLIGNAANTLHPVAGQGFNLALRDVAQLYDCLNELTSQVDTLTSRLAIYQQQRRTDQNRTVQLGNGLINAFSNNVPMWNHLRAGALAALDLCPPLKQEFAWQGMGFGEGCSSLMRGVS